MLWRYSAASFQFGAVYCGRPQQYARTLAGQSNCCTFLYCFLKICVVHILLIQGKDIMEKIWKKKTSNVPISATSRELLFNYRYCGKAISFNCSDCVSVALGIQHVILICHIDICGVCGSTLFFHIISQTAPFQEKNFLFHGVESLLWSQPVLG